ncbi:MAG: PAS domain-containing sensor histidine kinase [Acidobacteria bacterium]|nr:PAS domain-containing sensor histidine kinase [Acidobacteriota bacterium]MCA1610072.1 PAS domain-containing sensor histidine kinase [Acidobacteriota bacterium]
MGPHRLSHERRVFLLALLAALPGSVTGLILLWTGSFPPRVQWTLTVVIAAGWLLFSTALRERVIVPLQTVSNLLGAMREGDFSIRARGARPDDALGEVLIEVNALTETLRQQRLGALEATALLRKVMAEIDVAVFAFDASGRLKLTNRFGEHLLGQPEPRLLGARADELGLDAFLRADAPRVADASFPGGTGRWEIRQSAFRQGGLPHHLLVLADVSEPLREQERQAWQRLIRVLGHELNNSLAPIQSLAGSLESLVSREDRPSDWREDMRRGLTIISARAEALSRFTGAYAKLARLPQPRKTPVEVGALVARVAALETRLPVQVATGPPIVVRADADQLEQLLINLLRNAVDAALETSGAVQAGWSRGPGRAEIWVADGGPGLPNSANLFVPFFTTKASGSGIGLVLSRQIAEAHGGTLSLENRREATGCIAKLILPVR